MISSKHIETPLGKLFAEANSIGITRFGFVKQSIKQQVILQDENALSTADNHILMLQQELDEYFSGARKDFTVPLSPTGTSFQIMVWNALAKIPYGITCTYLQLARNLKLPDAVRAVAGANARNPIMILVPCHRVNGTDGSLTGYAGGLKAKNFLLELESGRKMPEQLTMEFPEMPTV